MDERQIKKAAQELCTTETQPDWMKDFGVNCFMDGARWRINSVWHDANEMPNGNEKCLVELRFPGKKNPKYFLWTRGWENSFVTRWAYLSDLLPERKEETK